jgi:transposase-like protein
MRIPYGGVDVEAKERGERSLHRARRKVEAVMRLLKGEDLDTVSRELGATAATLSEWRDAFLKSAEAGLKSREPSAADEENLRLRAKVGELTMEVELLREKAEKLEVNAPHFPWRKSRP